VASSCTFSATSGSGLSSPSDRHITAGPPRSSRW
jgi:hypothetical protein